MNDLNDAPIFSASRNTPSLLPSLDQEMERLERSILICTIGLIVLLPLAFWFLSLLTIQ
jgi:hypothetical protein